MKTEQPFLGTGWSFPPRFTKETESASLSTGVQDIHESLRILLSTKVGERIMAPKYGCNLQELLFEPLNLTIKTYIKELVKTAILYYEPRIEVIKIAIDNSNELNGEVLLELDYMVRITNSRGNIVFPFYKQEGSEV
ncbi:MAG: hypothetical protein CL868_14945 [Cytophagaceae bacterium]|mgnify:FL=1|nr:hypothetical protein [Cytophagaceae bacterium]